MESNSTIKNTLIYSLLVLLILFPLFGHIKKLPIRQWDESRLAINAYEMYKSGNYLIPTYNGTVDMWNTKPPLMIWCQVGLMKLIGVSELAVRLPSALAGFLLCIALLIFCHKILKNQIYGVIGILVLITSEGFYLYHGCRTGDYDSLLCLFTSLSSLLFFAYIENKKIRYLYGFFVVLSLGVLTKSITGLLFLPAFFIYLLLKRELFPILKNKHFYFGTFLFLIPIIIYYCSREIYNPGYFSAVIQNEITGRYLNTIENHKQNFWFYFETIFNKKIPFWVFFTIAGSILSFSLQDQKLKNFAQYILLLSFTFLVIISFSQTKLDWYDLPVLPFLSFLAALFLYLIYKSIVGRELVASKLNQKLFGILFLVSIFFYPYKLIFQKTNFPKENPGDYELYNISNYLNDVYKKNKELDFKYISYEGYNAHVKYYVDILNDHGRKVEFKDWKELKADDTVLVSHKAVQSELEKRYSYEVLLSERDLKGYRIISNK